MGKDYISSHHTKGSSIIGTTSNIHQQPQLMHNSYAKYFDMLIEKMKKLVAEGHEIVWGKTENWCSINGQTFNVPKDVWEIRSNPNYVPERIQGPNFGSYNGKLFSQPVTVTDLINDIIDLDPSMESNRTSLYHMSKNALVKLLKEKRCSC